MLKQEIMFPKKRGMLTEPVKLTEPHYMFCGPLLQNTEVRLTELVMASGVAIPFRPGPAIKVQTFPPLTFAYKNLKWKKIMFRA